MRAAIPVPDGSPYAAAARRTGAVRAGVVAALAGAAAAAIVAAPSGGGSSALLGPGSGSIVVLDVSASVASQRHQRAIAAVLRRLSDSPGRLGLVVFSDVAYEALPPGTPAAELAALVRFFDRPAGEGRARPGSPWAGSLSGGTKIWAGLALARQILRRDRIEDGSVLLVSDLADAPNDRALLADTIVSYVRERIPLRVVALDPAPEDERLFRDFVQRQGAFVRVEASAGRAGPLSAPFPAGLAAAAGALLLLVALAEQALAPLRWRGGGRP